MKKILLTAILLCSLLFTMAASAQGLKSAGSVLKGIGGDSGEKLGVSNDLAATMATVIKTVLALVGTIFLILTIYAGIMWMTAAGNEEQVTKAVGMIKAAVIGLVIIMSAYAITYFVTTKLTGAVTNTNSDTPASSDPAGCCYVTNSEANCTPYPDFPRSQCNNLHADDNDLNVLWEPGSCQSQCPNRIDL